MAEVMTPWGYAVDPGEGGWPRPLVTLDEFHDMTAHRFVDDERIGATIAAVSAAVRNWCGWHVSPSLPCSCELDGGTRTLWLPCMAVTGIASVEVGGGAVGFEWSQRGEVRLARRAPDALRGVRVSFTAGVDSAEDLAALVAGRVAHSVALPLGVSAEASGGVSVTYAADAVRATGGVSLSASERAALAPYRVATAM